MILAAGYLTALLTLAGPPAVDNPPAPASRAELELSGGIMGGGWLLTGAGVEIAAGRPASVFGEYRLYFGPDDYSAALRYGLRWRFGE